MIHFIWRMVMTSDWEELKNKKTEPGKLSVTLISANYNIRKFINHEKKIGLIVGCYSLDIDNEVFTKKLPKLSQIRISWNFGNQPSLMIVLQEESFEDQFKKFIDIIIEKIRHFFIKINDADKEEELIKTVINECFKWSLFLKPSKERKLNIQKQKGLISELLFLQNIFKHLDSKSSLNAWTGPDGFSKDFIINNIGFEIKSIQTGNKNKITISNHDQLDFVGLNKLFLVTYLLSFGSKDSKLSFTLTDIVNKIRIQLESDQDSKFIFENKLTNAGYSDLDDYSDNYFIQSDKSSYYSISDNFPSITADKINIKSIIRVNYDLDISTLEEFSVEELNVINDIKEGGNISDINNDNLKEKIEKGETKFVEFKQSLSLDLNQLQNNKKYSPKKETYLNEVIVKTINAFLNTEGGELFIGVKDDPIQIYGIEKELEMLYKSSTDNIQLHIAKLIEDYIGLQFNNFINFKIILIENKQIIHFVCKKSKKPSYLKGTKFFIRSGPSSVELKGEALMEYINERFK